MDNDIINHPSTCRLDCAFYMFMNAKHYTDGGEIVYLTEEQVPELRQKILYQIISQYRDTDALSLINYTAGLSY